MRTIIESPFRGRTQSEADRNRAYLLAALTDSLARGEAPLASHALYTQVLDDRDADERAQGIAAGQAWMAVAERVAVYDDYGISPGMKLGIAEATRLGLPIEYRKLEAKK